MLRKEFKVDNLDVKVYDSRRSMGEEAGKEAAEYLRGLLAKQDEIDKVIETAVNTLKNLESDDYFKVILHMVPKYAPSKDGVICFSSEDLARLPEGFEDEINKALDGRASLTLSDKPADINGGFILKYGDIEENCSFDALIESSKETLQDKIGQILFE